MSKQNYTVARVVTHTRNDIGKFERHIERKNNNYLNMNVDLSQSHRNIQFKKCECTYNDKLNEMVESKQVSLRGLKADAKVYDEIIFDVNTEYFEEHGGYEFARKFYESAFHFARKEMGTDNIISAIMHADEINIAMSDRYGYPVYHYHLHIVALPVVEKEIKWSKRCKNPELVGTVKEVINQVSHSKKWKSDPMIDENGKTVLVPSYSLLQDRFYEYMRNEGFTDFVRGERGSTKENLSVLDYKISKDKQRLDEITKKIEILEPIQKQIADVDNIQSKKTITGKIQMSEDDFNTVINLAKAGIENQSKIELLNMKIRALKEENKDLRRRLQIISDHCRDYALALKLAPQRVKTFINDIIQKSKEKAQQKQQEDQKPKSIYKQRTKRKTREKEWER